jgi:hypothetical protein
MHEEPKHFDNLTTEQLIERTELTWLRYIKLCQDNFLMFVQEMWPQFICRKEKNENASISQYRTSSAFWK